MGSTERGPGDRRVHLTFGLVAAALSASIPLVPLQGYAAVTSIVLLVVVVSWLIYSLRR